MKRQAMDRERGKKMIFLGVTSGEKKDILARVDIDRR